MTAAPSQPTPAPDQPAEQADDAASHRRPEGASDQLVETMGTLSEALEYVVRARGHLYSAHQLIGRADLLLDDVVDGLRGAGAADAADHVQDELLGRNVLDGRWTFQIVEEFDRTYYDVWVAVEARLREQLMAGRRHVFESELKDRRRTRGRRWHERRPPAAHDPAVVDE
jgi:hypothetical protein